MKNLCMLLVVAMLGITTARAQQPQNKKTTTKAAVDEKHDAKADSCVHKKNHEKHHEKEGKKCCKMHAEAEKNEAK